MAVDSGLVDALN